MDRGRAAAALLALATCIACSAAAPTADNQALDLYKEPTEGCYYNFQHYREGDRIMTNEPCLNCTCHNKMLMCYLKVCPFTKAIGQDCTVEKRADQCCPIVTCPDVPVDLLTSTSTTSPAEYGDTGVVKADKYGCTINGKYLPEGAKVPPTPNKPCEHCYCIRNMTTCVMQECTLHVDGCTPIYRKDVCCPVRYVCDHPEDEIPLLDDMTTTVRPTPGFILTTTTTTEAPVTETESKKQCVKNDQVYEDGARLETENPCEHCFCMKGDVVCVVQECGMPVEHEGKSCTALPPRKGQCCPDRYICDGDEMTTDSTAETPFDELNTILPPKRVIEEGSGYRKESDDIPPIETEGSGEEPEIQKTTPLFITETDMITDALDNKYGMQDTDKVPTTSQTSHDYETSEPSIDLNQYSEDEESKLTSQPSEFKTTEKTIDLHTTPVPDITEQYSEPTVYDTTTKKDKIEEYDRYTTLTEIMQVTTKSSLPDLITEKDDIITTTISTKIDMEKPSATTTEKVQTETLKPDPISFEKEYSSTDETIIDDLTTRSSAKIEPEVTESDESVTYTTAPIFYTSDDSEVSTQQAGDELEPDVSTSIITDKDKESEQDELRTSTSKPIDVTQEDITEFKTTISEKEIPYTTENIPEKEKETTPYNVDKLTTSIPNIAKETSLPSEELLPITEQSTDEPKLTEESISPTESQEPISITEKPELPNIPNPEENDVSPPGRIPGEGDCLLNGIHYKNDTNVPSTNKCHSSCKCISSIISCDPIICSMPPEYMDNCKAVYDTPDSCCPTFVCDQSKETVPPQPHSQMQGTESPVSSTSVECKGDDCEDRQQIPNVISPDLATKKDDKPVCVGAECIDEKVSETPVVICEGEECKQAILPETSPFMTPEIVVSGFTKPECYGEECKKIDNEASTQPTCEGEDCKRTSVPEVSDCVGEQCKASGISETLAPTPEIPSCEGQACKETTSSQEEPEDKLTCVGDLCNKVQIPDISSPICKGEACGSSEQSETKPSCEGEHCDKGQVPELVTPACEGEACSYSKQPEIKPSCEGEKCDKGQIPEVLAPACEGEACSSSKQPEIKPTCEGEQCGKGQTPEVSEPACEGEQCDKGQIPQVSTPACEGEACSSSEPPEIKPNCEGEQCDKSQIPEVSTPACEGEACSSSEQPEIKPSCEGEQCGKGQIPEVSEPACEGEQCDKGQIPQVSTPACEGEACSSSEPPEIKPNCEGEQCDKSQIPEVSTPACKGEACSSSEQPEIKPSCEGEQCGKGQTPEVSAPACEGEQCDKGQIPQVSTPACEGEACSSSEPPEIKPNCEGEQCDKSQIPEVSTPACEGEACSSSEQPEIKPSCEGEQCGKGQIPEVSAPACEGEQCDKGQIPQVSTPACEGEACSSSEPPEIKPSCEGEQCSKGQTPEVSEPACEGEQCDKGQVPELVTPACEGEACSSSEQLEIKPSCEGEQCDKSQIPEISTPTCEGEACSSSDQPEIKPTCEGEQCDKGQTSDISASACEGEACSSSEQPETKPSCDGEACSTDELPENQPNCEGDLCNKVQIPEISSPVCESEACKQTPEKCKDGICRKTEEPESQREESCEGKECLQSQTTESNLGDQKETTSFVEKLSPLDIITTTVANPTESPHILETTDILTSDVSSENIDKNTESSYPTSIRPELESTNIEEKLNTSISNVSVTMSTESADEDLITIPTVSTVLQKETHEEDEPTRQDIITTEPSKVMVSVEFTTEIPQTVEPQASVSDVSVVTKSTESTDEGLITMPTVSSIVQKETHEEVEPIQQDIITTEPSKVMVSVEFTTESPQTVEPQASVSEFESKVTEPSYDDLAEKTTLNSLFDKDIKQKPVDELQISTISPEDLDNEIITKSPQITTTELPIVTAEQVTVLKETENKSDVTNIPMEYNTGKPTFETKSPFEEQTTKLTTVTEIFSTEADKQEIEITTLAGIPNETVSMEAFTTNTPISSEDKVATTLENAFTTQRSEPSITQETEMRLTQAEEVDSEKTTQASIRVTTTEQTPQNNLVDHSELSSSLDITGMIKGEESGTLTQEYELTTQPTLSLVTKSDKSTEDKSEFTVTFMPSKTSKTPDDYLTSTETSVPSEEKSTDKIHSESDTTKITVIPVHVDSITMESTTNSNEILQTKPSRDEIEDITATSKIYESTTARIIQSEEQQTSTEVYQTELIPTTDLLPVKFGEVETEKPQVIDKYAISEKEIPSTEQTPLTEKTPSQENEVTVEPVAVSSQDDVKLPDMVPEDEMEKSTTALEDFSGFQESTTYKMPVLETSVTKSTETSIKDFTESTTSGLPDISITDIKTTSEELEKPSETTPVVTEIPSKVEEFTQKVETEEPVTSEVIRIETEQPEDKIKGDVTESPLSATTDINKHDTQSTTVQKEKFDQTTPVLPDVSISTKSSIIDEKTESSTKPDTEEIKITKLPEIMETTELQESSDTTPYSVELEEHPHKFDETSPSFTEQRESTTEIFRPQPTEEPNIEKEQIYTTTEDSNKGIVPVSAESSTPTNIKQQPDSSDNQFSEIEQPKETTIAVELQEDVKTTMIVQTERPFTTERIKEQTEKEILTTGKPLEPLGPEEEFIPAKDTTTVAEEAIAQTSSDKFTSKPSEKPVAETSKPSFSDFPPSEEISPPEDENQFPPSGGYGQEPDYGDEDQAFGPGTCRYGGKIYVSAQQIPRDDPCDFCFCFRSDIICLQQSCPPPIHGCHEEPIQGFCCPRYECPVSMATTLNVTTTTTTTTTTLPPHFLPHAYKGAAQRRGCHIKGHTYKVGEVVRASSGPCLHCTCGGDGQMKCDPKVCTPEPMLRQMIAAAVSAKRRR